MEIDKYISEQGATGRHDSEGVFTMAVKEASWKLADYLLTNPDLFPVHLLACAVAGGASHLRIKRAHIDTFEFNGAPFTIKDLRRLSKPLAGGSADRRLHELGVVLNVARAKGVVTFTSAVGGRGIRAKVATSGEVTVEEYDCPRSDVGQTLTIENFSGGVDFRKLEDLGRLALIEVTINGNSIRKPADLGMESRRLYAHYYQEGSPKLLARKGNHCAYHIARFEKRNKQARSVVVALSWPAFAMYHGWVFVADGVAHKVIDPQETFPFACGVIEASDLKRDLSGSGFIRNAQFANVWKLINHIVERTIIQLISDKKIDMSPEHRLLLSMELSKRYRNRETPPEVVSYLARQDTLDSPLDNLVTAGKAAQQGKMREVFEDLLRDQRCKASLCYGHSNLDDTLAWLRREKVALREASRDTVELDSLVRCLKHIHQLMPWDASVEVAGVRGDLIAGSSADFGPPTPWTAPLIMLRERTQGLPPRTKTDKAWQAAFDIWDACEAGDFDAALSTIEEQDSKIWRAVVLRLYSGKMSFLQETRWKIKQNFLAFGHSPRERRAERLLAEEFRRWDSIAPLLDSLHLGPVFVPLVMSRVIHFCQMERMNLATDLLGRVMLQASLLYEGILKADKELPAFPDFPPDRLWA